MVDAQTSQAKIDETARFIVEPVAVDLDRVIANLVAIARESGLPGGGMAEQAIASGGKKVRPIITLLAGALRPSDADRIVTMATAIELLHIASLIHDDTVDQADTRRGRPTVSSMFGGDVAVLLGDYVFASSAVFVCDTGNIRVIRRFSETIMELARGELAERFSIHDWSQSIDDYKLRIYEKTASLISTAAESGGVLSGAPEEHAQALCAFGCNVGMAFQIVDDVLDFTGNEEELGKPAGADLLQGTLTLPALLYAARSPEDPVVKRLRAGSRDEEDLRAMVSLIRESSVIDEALEALESYRAAARAALAALPDVRSRDSLEALIDYVTLRRS